MKTLSWHKIYTDKFLCSMHKFPNDIIGKWMRVFCTMANSKKRWTLEGTLEEWSRIIAEKPGETKRFINFVHDNFPNVKVITSVYKGKENKVTYSMTELFYSQKTLEPEIHNVKNAITTTRNNMIQAIIEAYHPEKTSGENSKFKKVYIKLMQNTSRGVKKYKDRIELEADIGNIILNHIEYLKTTAEWHDPTLLKSLPEYILSRAWIGHDCLR